MAKISEKHTHGEISYARKEKLEARNKLADRKMWDYSWIIIVEEYRDRSFHLHLPRESNVETKPISFMRINYLITKKKKKKKKEKRSVLGIKIEKLWAWLVYITELINLPYSLIYVSVIGV